VSCLYSEAFSCNNSEGKISVKNLYSLELVYDFELRDFVPVKGAK
jgi:hypothetical protein